MVSVFQVSDLAQVGKSDFGCVYKGFKTAACKLSHFLQGYSGIGINKLREITNDEHCKFVLWVGSKRLIKRRLFDAYMEQVYSI